MWSLSSILSSRAPSPWASCLKRYAFYSLCVCFETSPGFCLKSVHKICFQNLDILYFFQVLFKIKQEAQGPLSSVGSLVRLEQIMPNGHVATSYVDEVTIPNFDI